MTRVQEQWTDAVSVHTSIKHPARVFSLCCEQCPQASSLEHLTSMQLRCCQAPPCLFYLELVAMDLFLSSYLCLYFPNPDLITYLEFTYPLSSKLGAQFPDLLKQDHVLPYHTDLLTPIYFSPASWRPGIL